MNIFLLFFYSTNDKLFNYYNIWRKLILNLNYTDPDKINRQRIFIIRFLYWGIILFCAAVFAKYILPVLFPFIIACLILFMTFMELFIGLKILKVPYAGIIAFVIAILDILPVLGTGGVLIPWSIVSLILGDFITAAGIIILYIVITVIRNIVEPRLIGKQMGLHPVVTLAAMLVGLNLFGIVGLFGFPILFSFLKNHSVKKKEDLCYNDNSEEGGRKDE